MTANDSRASAAVGSLVSSLMDGDLEPDSATGALARWRVDGDLRATWPAYQLSGDGRAIDIDAAGVVFSVGAVFRYGIAPRRLE